ncbi:nucleotide pyrophosphohydrolase [Clostridium manihotivorum]|uniref:Nucleotide pyrophosphohydrolase n=2 Tax=Clostridium manihotivorum TaxID=2320868 RepID=A0A3R5QXV8_9CLOT|nr:nucleotide pyrophosphohydrolase [Clostridium manihotivorum]
MNGALGLGGEAGEVQDYIKKVLFHGHKLDKEKLKEELGDVLWYIGYLAYIQGMTLEEIAIANIEKLLLRYPNGFNFKDSIMRRDTELMNIR